MTAANPLPSFAQSPEAPEIGADQTGAETGTGTTDENASVTGGEDTAAADPSPPIPDPTLDSRPPLEAFAATIVTASGAKEDRSAEVIKDAQRLAAEAGEKLLNAGNVVGLETFTNTFYEELYPEGEADVGLVWSRLSGTEKFRAMSSEIQFLRIRAGLLQYTYALQAPSSDLDSPTELLEERRDILMQILDDVRQAQDVLFDRRRETGADRYRQISSALHIAAAEVYMHIADAGFRLRAASLLTELSSGAVQTNSSANYGAARQSVFEALLLDPDSVRAKFLAGEIEERLDWLRTGRAFGGGRFFEVEPVMGQFDGARWTPLGKLETIQKRLEELDPSQAQQSADALEEFIKDFTDRLQLNQRRRQEQIAQLSREIADLEFRIQQTELSASQALEANAQIIRDRLAVSETTRGNLEQRSAALDSEIGNKADDLRRALDALAEVTSQGDLFDPGKFKAFANTAKEVMDDTNALVDAVAGFDVKSLKDRARTLKASFERSKTAAGRSVDIIEFEIERLKAVRGSVEDSIKQVDIAVQTASTEFFEEEARNNIEEIKSEINSLQNQIEDSSLSTAQELKDIRDEIFNLTLGRFEREKARVEAKIDDAKAKIQSASQLIDLYKTNKKRVEEAITAAQLAVEAAGAIPSGIIAGTASGTFNQKPQALMKVQELGLKILDTAQKVEMDIRKAQDIINDLKGLVEDYGNALASLNDDEMKAKLEKGIEDAKAEGRDLKADLLAKVKAQEAQIAQALKESGERIKQRFELSLAKFSAQKDEFEAEIAAIDAEINAFQARITAEQRRARALVDEIAVIRGDLGRLTLEKQGIENSIERTQQQTDEDVRGLQNAAALEAEQFDEITQPLVRRIATLRQISDSLAQGGASQNLDLPMGQLTARSLGPTADALARERLALMDEANQLLFQYANWLYLMTRDPVALSWAISAQSPEELTLAMTRLNTLYETLKRTTGLATPRYFVVRLSKDVIDQVYRDENDELAETLSFTVNPALSGLARKPPLQRIPGTPGSIGQERISVYEPLELFLEQSAPSGLLDDDPAGVPQVPLPGKAEAIFAPFVETEGGAHHLLWDAWVIPNWAGEPPSELSMVGLEPVGPTFYNLGDQVRGHPVLRGREANYTATAYSYDRLREQHELALRFVTAGPERSLIEGTLPGMNYRSLLGRGLGNTWTLKAPKEWSTLRDQAPDFQGLESIDVVFGYLIAPERTVGSASDPEAQIARLRQIQEGQAEPVEAKRICAPLKNQWLCDLRDLQRQDARAIRAKARFEAAKPTGETSAGGQRGDFRQTYQFGESSAATLARLSTLSEMARSMPRGGHIVFPDLEKPLPIHVIDFWQKEAVRRAFAESYCLDEQTDKGRSCETRGRPGPPSYGALTKAIVRDEMLSWPDSQAAAVGPLELIRTWRGLERLFGRLDPDEEGAADGGQENEGDGLTLLSETRRVEQNLALVGAQMEALHEHIAGPVLMARHWVNAYETARMQLDFVEKFTTALSNMSDVNKSRFEQDKAFAAVLQRELASKLVSLHCAEAWFLAAQAAGLSTGDARAMAPSVVARMIDALEPGLKDLTAPGEEGSIELVSFPFEECRGIFVDAQNQIEAQQRAVVAE
ncbi:hypothetical protein [Ruegeria sp. HKCCD7318]|uniref:hypothetical protein n=1 Tax=Ruegeria sp. HKCCD7318 TaxID=2683014 RepID=UPI001C0FBEB0|nr:hypothetical protein [Ruegeria sp. HKCCD7318]